MKRNDSACLILSMCAVAAASSLASAGVVVNDRWSDSTRTDPAPTVYSEDGVDSDFDGDIESAWFRTGTGSSTTMSAGHMVHAAGAGSSMSLTTYFSQSAVSLGAVGDKMTITWVFTPSGVTTTSTGNQDMRIAIADSATRLAADGTPASQVYSGYGMFFNMRAGTIGANNAFRIMEWATPGGANNLLSTAAAWTQVAAMPTVANTTPGFASGTEYTLTWSITKTASGADIAQSIVGGNVNLSATFSDASAQPLTFDTFGIRPQTPELSAASFDTTLFRVEFTPIPEPASLAVAAAGLGLLRRRR